MDQREHDRIVAAVTWKSTEYESLREMAADAGLPEGAIATISRIMRSEHVNATTMRQIARKLGVIPPRKTYYRPCIAPASLQEIATGREIEQLLAEMERLMVDMDYVIEALVAQVEIDAEEHAAAIGAKIVNPTERRRRP